MHKFDIETLKTIENLSKIFNVDYTKQEDIISKYTIGIEIEIKFKYFFPELFIEHFEGRKWSHYTIEQKQYISNLISAEEKGVLPYLEKTIACGIPRGNDKYWEYSFTPVTNLTLLIYQIDLLKKTGLFPDGKHSLHITVGGEKLQKRHYYVLMVLQLLYLDKERIKDGFSEYEERSGTWGKKGRAGIFKKIQCDLVNQDHGFEFRTLFIDENTDLFKMFSALNFLLTDIEESNKVIELVKNCMSEYGLPDKNWENPHQNTEIWNRFIDNFDNMSLFTKGLMF